MSIATREAYRLRLAVRRTDGRVAMMAIEGECRLFATWREAMTAAATVADRRGDVVTQAVLVNEAGRVVFPTDERAPVSGGKWNLAPVIRLGPRRPREHREPRPPRPMHDKRPRAARQAGRRLGLDPRVARRIAEIRAGNPWFGKAAVCDAQ
jgi:hypothetical protein